jgi:hypothetical protein
MNNFTFEEIYCEINKQISNFEISTNTLIIILQNILEIVEINKNNDIHEKAFVMSLLKKIVNEADIDDNEKYNCNLIINNGTISNTIDLIKDTSNKNTKLNKKKSLLRRILSRRKRKKTAEDIQRKSGDNRRNSKDKKK